MPKTDRQKLKLLYLRDFLLRYSDENHPVTMKQILEYLSENDIPAERKSIYSDMEALRSYGMDIVKTSDRYFVGNRDFELPELKLLVDSVQSSKFITYKKTGTLIGKIEKMASVHEAQLLNRQVFVTNRIKSMNESIYYNVDEIHNGIAHNEKIRFHYFEWNAAKQKVLRHNGAWYEVSPYALTWDDENYYMVACDGNVIKHYRVDKMADIDATGEAREGQELFSSLDMAVYARKTFGMFSGADENVTLRASNRLAGAILDRFGRDASLVPDGDEHFTVRVDVLVSPQFFSWVNAFGGEVMITAPASVVEQNRKLIEKLGEAYRLQEQA